LIVYSLASWRQTEGLFEATKPGFKSLLITQTTQFLFGPIGSLSFPFSTVVPQDAWCQSKTSPGIAAEGNGQLNNPGSSAC
jgi:hypothetical protein